MTDQRIVETGGVGIVLRFGVVEPSDWRKGFPFVFIADGEIVTVLFEIHQTFFNFDGWLRVRTAAGHIGWIPSFWAERVING